MLLGASIDANTEASKTESNRTRVRFFGRFSSDLHPRPRREQVRVRITFFGERPDKVYLITGVKIVSAQILARLRLVPNGPELGCQKYPAPSQFLSTESNSFESVRIRRWYTIQRDLHTSREAKTMGFIELSETRVRPPAFAFAPKRNSPSQYKSESSVQNVYAS